ncbi:Cyclin-dependent kinase inhibitor [Teladorsagia circumcincta]|uniref:Cyclin-dependent kinase inhibitor n=1 Tax=Teladorsagia circumcincta TaxID=45464 RepID=A0A2G9V0H6_TELCI|nr:Cyclin-dependent kinase inhibitor [Teladorsagia circumcincta]
MAYVRWGSPTSPSPSIVTRSLALARPDHDERYIMGPVPTMENSSPGKHRRVKRCLFGKPDPDQVEKWLSDTTDKQLKNSREKWNYDFKLDKPIAGDIEYETVPMEKVPSVYKPHVHGKRKTRRVVEFDPNVPSASCEEAKGEPDAVVHRPLTRSCTKLQVPKNPEVFRGLKQAKLTNYLKVSKRRSVDQRSSKNPKVSLETLKSPPPNSPFRFAAEVEGCDASDSARSGSSSPPKSPRKRPATKSSAHTSPRLAKLRSHAVSNR